MKLAKANLFVGSVLIMTLAVPTLAMSKDVTWHANEQHHPFSFGRIVVVPYNYTPPPAVTNQWINNFEAWINAYHQKQLRTQRLKKVNDSHWATGGVPRPTH